MRPETTKLKFKDNMYIEDEPCGRISFLESNSQNNDWKQIDKKLINDWLVLVKVKTNFDMNPIIIYKDSDEEKRLDMNIQRDGDIIEF